MEEVLACGWLLLPLWPMVMPGLARSPGWPCRACNEAGSVCSCCRSWFCNAGEERRNQWNMRGGRLRTNGCCLPPPRCLPSGAAYRRQEMPRSLTWVGAPSVWTAKAPLARSTEAMPPPEPPSPPPQKAGRFHLSSCRPLPFKLHSWVQAGSAAVSSVKPSTVVQR